MFARLCALPLFLCLVFPAAAAYIYTLDYAGSDGGGAIQPFSVTFTTPNILSAGDPYSYSPVVITDGTDSWTLTQSASTDHPTQGHCFLLASAGGGSLVNGANTECSLGFPNNGEAALWFFTGAATLPQTTGVFPNYYVAVLATDSLGAQSTSTSFLSSVTIASTAVPEPSSMVLFAIGIAALVLFRRRYA